MNYIFKTHKSIVNSIWHLIELNEKEYHILNNFTDTGWTAEKAQSIIDSVELNKTLESRKDPYIWGNEDIAVYASKIGVLLIDRMAMRAKQETTGLELTHEEFISFMKDFKKFIENNQ